MPLTSVTCDYWGTTSLGTSGSCASLARFYLPNTICAFVAFLSSCGLWFIMLKVWRWLCDKESFQNNSSSIKIILLFLSSRKQWVLQNVKMSTKM